MNRHERRRFKKLTGQWIPGVQDKSETILQQYWIPLKRKSNAGVVYEYYKIIIDKIGLNKNNDKPTSENSINQG